MDRISKSIIGQIVAYMFFTLAFFLIIYNNRIIYISSLIGLSVLSVYLLYHSLKKKKFISIIFSIFILVSSIILMIVPLNIFYVLFGEIVFKDAIGLIFNFDLIWFGYYYFWLVMFAIISETIIGLYYRYSIEEYPTESGYGIWDYFINDPDYKKVILLLILLGIASIFEEIVFRFFAINILFRMGLIIPLVIIITAIIFGLAHFNNGGWIYTVNSTFAGFIFAFVFIQFNSLITVWIIHFLWNFLVVYQMYLPQLYEKVKSSSEKKGGVFIWKPR